MSIICFTGFSKSGKDTAAGILQTQTGLQSFHFAKQLKIDLARLLEIDVSVLYSPDKDGFITLPNGSTLDLRKAMRDLSWVYKNQDPAYYAKSLILELGQRPNAIVTDLRFHVEIDTLKEYYDNVVVVRVVSDKVVDKSGAISEVEHLEINPDYILENNSTIDELQLAVHNLISDIQKGEENGKSKESRASRG